MMRTKTSVAAKRAVRQLNHSLRRVDELRLKKLPSDHLPTNFKAFLTTPVTAGTLPCPNDSTYWKRVSSGVSIDATTHRILATCYTKVDKRHGVASRTRVWVLELRAPKPTMWYVWAERGTKDLPFSFLPMQDNWMETLQLFEMLETPSQQVPTTPMSAMPALVAH